MYLNRILIIFPLIPSRQIRHVVLLDEALKLSYFLEIESGNYPVDSRCSFALFQFFLLRQRNT